MLMTDHLDARSKNNRWCRVAYVSITILPLNLAQIPTTFIPLNQLSLHLAAWDLANTIFSRVLCECHRVVTHLPLCSYFLVFSAYVYCNPLLLTHVLIYYISYSTVPSLRRSNQCNPFRDFLIVIFSPVHGALPTIATTFPSVLPAISFLVKVALSNCSIQSFTETADSKLPSHGHYELSPRTSYNWAIEPHLHRSARWAFPKSGRRYT